MSPTRRLPAASKDGVPRMRSSSRRRGVSLISSSVRVERARRHLSVDCYNALPLDAAGGNTMRPSAWIGLRAITLALALAVAGCSHEGADWKAASGADTSEAYQQFLQQHPNSANAAQARTRIQQLQEVRDWQAAGAADTRDAYEQFLTQHPDSQWAQEARIRIENFAQSGTPAAPAANAAPAPSVAPAPRNAG